MGDIYEPERKSMLGFRGAGRYVSDSFRACFCIGMQKRLNVVHNTMGLTNVEVMIPWTVAQASL